MIELLIVMIIVAILMAVAVPSIKKASAGPEAPTVAVSGGRIWRAVQLFRLDSGGVLPTTAQMAGKGPGLLNPAGKPLVSPWPETTKGAPLPITASPSAPALPPNTGTPNTLVYAAAPAAQPVAGWLAGYGPTGRIVFSRVISPSTTTGGPIG